HCIVRPSRRLTRHVQGQRHVGVGLASDQSEIGGCPLLLRNPKRLKLCADGALGAILGRLALDIEHASTLYWCPLHERSPISKRQSSRNRPIGLTGVRFHGEHANGLAVEQHVTEELDR